LAHARQSGKRQTSRWAAEAYDAHVFFSAGLHVPERKWCSIIIVAIRPSSAARYIFLQPSFMILRMRSVLEFHPFSSIYSFFYGPHSCSQRGKPRSSGVSARKSKHELLIKCGKFYKFSQLHFIHKSGNYTCGDLFWNSDLLAPVTRWVRSKWSQQLSLTADYTKCSELYLNFSCLHKSWPTISKAMVPSRYMSLPFKDFQPTIQLWYTIFAKFNNAKWYNIAESASCKCAVESILINKYFGYQLLSAIEKLFLNNAGNNFGL